MGHVLDPLPLSVNAALAYSPRPAQNWVMNFQASGASQLVD